MTNPFEPDFAPARVLVTGSTTWSDRIAIAEILGELAQRRSGRGSFRIITGMADGADEIARMWATTNDVQLLAEPLEEGRYPGPMHDYNEKMLTWEPELVLAFKESLDPDWAEPDCCAGTEHMCRLAAQAGVPVLLNGTAWLTATVPQERSTGTSAEKGDVHRTRWHGALVSARLGDITNSDAEVMVNAANSSLLGGGGVDGAIHKAAGPDLLNACREVVARQGGCKTGEAVMTRAGELAADYVVHTVGPVWTGADPNVHDALLARCYEESLRLATNADARSIAFPNISTGVYRFPLERAAQVATEAVHRWLETHPNKIDHVEFVCFNHENFDLYAQSISPTDGVVPLSPQRGRTPFDE